MESSTFEKTALIHPYIKTNLHTGCLRKIANKLGTQIAS